MDINQNHPASQDTLPSTGRMRAYFKVKIMRDSLRVKLTSVSPFPSSRIITHPSVQSASSGSAHKATEQSQHTPTISKTTCTTCMETACAHNVLPNHPPVFMMYHQAIRRKDSCPWERRQCKSAKYLDLPISNLCARKVERIHSSSRGGRDQEIIDIFDGVIDVV